MSNKRLQMADYIFKGKYSKTKPNGLKEEWNESVDRVMTMHFDFLNSRIPKENVSSFVNLIFEVTDIYKSKLVLGAQRLLQFGGNRMVEHPLKTFNCSGSPVDRPEFFHQLFYIALNGCGVGLSVQQCHTSKLPIVISPQGEEEFIVPDSIEGWALACKALTDAYFYGKALPIFNYSLIRPEGSLVTGEFSAPGHKPLKKCLNALDMVFKNAINRQLRPFECCRMSCMIADAVISGSIRRAALLTMFDAFDTEMLNAKTGPWWELYPELGRSNNSAVILPNTPKEVYLKLFKSAKDQGEPGIIFSKNENYLYNPCVEVGMYPFTDEGKSGFSFCNLTEINGSACTTKEEFFKACRAGAILGTFQAAYTWDTFVEKSTIDIMKRDALLGVSITGMCSNPNICFSPEIQKEGARIVKETNKEVAAILGINEAARCCVIKPSGTASLLLGCSSGIHPEAFRRYVRHIQLNNNEPVRQLFKGKAAKYIEPSYYYDKRLIESVAAFNVEVPKNALTQNDLSAIEFLDLVKLTQNNWIEEGTNWTHPSTLANPNLRMNVSNTCTVDVHEWDDVSEYLWSNRENFCGVSFLPKGGSLIYKQAPMSEVLTPNEMIKEYGDGVILASGLIMDGLEVFENLWDACDAATGINPSLLKWTDDDFKDFFSKNFKNGHFMAEVNGIHFSDINAVVDHIKHKFALRQDWVRRFEQFACNYFNCDNYKCSMCLKHVNLFYKWKKVERLDPLDWSKIRFKQEAIDAGSQMGTACSGGKCEVL